MAHQTQKKFISDVHLISDIYTNWFLSFDMLWLQLWWVAPHEMLNGWIILALGAISHILRESSIAMSKIWVYLLKKLCRKSNIKGISITHVATVQVQPGEFVSPIRTNMPVVQPCSFHVIFLILWSSLEPDNFPDKKYLIKVQIWSLSH